MQKKALQIGIDFSQKRADVGLFGPQGEIIINHRAFSNTRTGCDQFKQLVMETIQAYGFEAVHVSGEATSTYWMPFFMELAEDEALKDYLHQYLLNPRWVKWFKKCFAPDHKTDQRDPFYIAERTRTKPPSYEWKLDKEWLELRWLTRYRFHLVQDLIREKNFYQAYLFILNSAYTQQKPFSDLFSITSRKILSELDQMDWFSLVDTAEVMDYLDQISQHRLVNPLENAQKLQNIASERFLIDKDLALSLQNILNLMLQHILFITNQIKQVEIWITDKALHLPEVQCLKSIPGIGPVFSSGIAAEIGDLNRFLQTQKWDTKRNLYRAKDLRDLDAAIAKIAGLWWPQSSSGNFVAQDLHLAKSGNRYLRYYLIEAANQLRLKIPAYSAFYANKFSEATKHHHKRAIVLTARKSIRLFVGLLHRKELFRSEEAFS